jgi:uncharacterized protein (DUF305 family)
MRRTPLRLVSAAAIAAAVSFFTLAGAAVADGPAPKKKQSKFEQEFLTMTIDHHFAGVKMGEICVERNTDPDLDPVCSDIIEMQSQEIDEMRGYLRDWYGYDKEPMLDDMALEDLMELREARRGEEFDVLVSEMFIEHHRLQIRNSERCLRKAFHSELEDLCRRQIEAQSREIEIFEAVIERYEGDDGEHHGGGHHGGGHHGGGHHGGR